MTNSEGRRPSRTPWHPARPITRFLSASLVLLVFTVLGTQSAVAQNPNLDPTYRTVRLTEGFTPDPSIVPVTAGGAIQVSVGSCSYGLIANAPDVDFYYTTSTDSDLYIYANSGEDTMILVSRPNGSWICNDDSIGLDPVVYIPRAPAGRYDIWVGTIGSNGPATLYTSEIDPR
jgi:hypothetical protein